MAEQDSLIYQVNEPGEQFTGPLAKRTGWPRRLVASYLTEGSSESS